MGNWEEKKLGDILKIKHGYAFEGEFITNIENENILVTPGNFKTGGGFKYSGKKFYNGKIPEEYRLKSNDIILTMTDLSKESDTLGYAALVPNDKRIYLHNQRIGLVYDIDNRVSKNFLYWMLRTPWYQKRIVNTSNGANVKHTSPSRIYAYVTKVPDFSTQERIADILSNYDDLIENNTRRIELLEKASQELYKEWFVRFRFPNHENTKFVNGLPEGWEEKKLKTMFDIGSSKRVYLSDYVEEGIPFYRSKEIIRLSEGQAINEPLYISDQAFNNFNNKFGAPNKNDILITSVGTIGKCYISDGHEFYFKDGNLTWLRSSKNPLTALFVFCWLNSNYGQQILITSTIGTSQSALTIENLKNIKLIVPSEEVLIKFTNQITLIFEEKNQLQKQNQNIAKQRDLLLPRLMSGKLEV